ncbi:MAG TPA: hypothetical protein VK186_27175 [Candidatus Deferrimicrobium sp.]|nr:hypothetical protein [Candidatus Deferrimicrobium sp.]
MNKKVLFVMVVVLFMFFAAGTLAVKGENVDPTGVLQQYLQMEHNHLVAVNSFFNGVAFDQHPAYGCVAKEAYPMHTDGWSDQYVSELFPDQNVLSYETFDSVFTGNALVAHKDGNGNIFYVWHQLEADEVVLVKAEIEGNGTPQMAMARRPCGNPIFISVKTTTFYVDGIEVPWYVAKFILWQMGLNVVEGG